MVYTEFALSKVNKNDLIRIALDMEKYQNSILSDMKNEQSDIKKRTICISKSVTEEKKIAELCWNASAGVMSSIPDVKVCKYLGHHLILRLVS